MPNRKYPKPIRLGDEMQSPEDDLEWLPPSVEINICTARELAKQVPGIGPVLSNRIVEERKKNGLFENWEDLQRRVYGIGTKLSIKMMEHNVFIEDVTVWRTLRMPTM